MRNNLEHFPVKLQRKKENKPVTAVRQKDKQWHPSIEGKQNGDSSSSSNTWATEIEKHSESHSSERIYTDHHHEREEKTFKLLYALLS